LLLSQEEQRCRLENVEYCRGFGSWKISHDYKLNMESVTGTWALVIPLFLDFLKIKPNISMFQKNYRFKYIERYIQKEHMQKVPLKILYIFRKYKKDNSDKNIYYFTTIYYENFFFFIFLKI
jgi:hypothetical protein